MRVAVMQPYFYPYAGYFRLMAAADLFVVFDCVQFPRRGRIHRSQVPDGRGGERWLTLPLARHPRDTRIADLEFAAGARAEFDRRCRALPWLDRAGLPAGVAGALGGEMTVPLDFIEANMRAVAGVLGISTPLIRSSTLAVPRDTTGQGRVRDIAAACGATRYLNPPGGRPLYDAAFFAEAGMALEFLAPYRGAHVHLLHALGHVPRADLIDDAAGWEVERA